MIKKLISILIALSLIIISSYCSTGLSMAENKNAETIKSIPDNNENTKLEFYNNLLTKEELPAAVSYENSLTYGHKERLQLSENNEFTLVFKNTDDTETKYLFSYPVKFKDDNGEWKDISMKLTYDNNLEKYITKQSNILSAFSKNSFDGISLKYNNIDIKLIPITETSMEGILSDNCEIVEYKADDKTSYEYYLTYTGFKENIVVREYTGQTEYSFKLYTNGLYLTNKDEGLYLTDLKGDVKANIGDLIIFTADERNNGFGKMTFEMIKEGEEYILTLHINDKYLSDPNTAYPIKIDPTISVNYENGSSAIQDVTINSLAGSNGSSTQLFVSKRAAFGISRVLMKFPGLDLGDLAGPEILSAVVEIRDISCQASQQPIYCYDYLGNEYTRSYYPTANCVIAYGPSNDNILHFAKLENWVPKAKLGPDELVEHDSYQAYFENGDYGLARAYYVKND